MTFASQPTIPPRLSVQPEYLNLGLLDSDSTESSTHRHEIYISNISGGLLAGKIIPQYPWINVTPDEFRLAGGQTSVHAVRIVANPNTPSKEKKKIVIPNLLIINSNAGSSTIGCEYLLRKKEHKFAKYYPSFILVGLILSLILISISLFMANKLRYRYANIVATANIAMLHTQGVQTIEAQKVRSVTPTNFPAANQKQSTPQFDNENTTPISDNKEQVGPTFTPFVIDDTHNPETFIADYFEAINEQKINQSWQMYTSEYQQICCGQQGGDPYQVYLNQWEDIDKVLLVSAYLLERDVNPAPISVNIQYIHKDGITIDDSKVYWVVFDNILDTFLIDDIQ